MKLAIELSLGLICATSTAFSILSVLAAARHFRRPRETRPRGGSGSGETPPVSILKPLRGLDEESYENLSSFARQSYPTFEILFGAVSPDDPALEVARAIARDFPGVSVRIFDRVERAGENPKVNTLASLAREAVHPLILLSDSDVRVAPDYVLAMVRELDFEDASMLTSLYSSRARSWAGRFEALGTATEFQPGVLVARMLQRVRFGLGAGILIRREALDAIGGFPAIANHLADDYMLGDLCDRSGGRVELSTAVVEHCLGSPSTGDWIRRQVRWNRGIRVSRPAGYFGLVLTQGVAAAALFLAVSGGSTLGWGVFAATTGVRLAAATIVGGRFLKDPTVRGFFWLIPLRDLAGTVLWAAGLFGKTVEWRGQRYRLNRDGRISNAAASLLPSSRGGLRKDGR